jgi:hypothetical protein
MVYGGKKRHWTRSAVALAGNAFSGFRRWSGVSKKRQKKPSSLAIKAARKTRTRGRGGQSYTKTKKGSMFQSAKPGVGGTFSSYVENHRARKGSGWNNKMLGKSVQSLSGALRLTGANGVQGIVNSMQTCSNSQLTTMAVQAGGTGARDSFKYFLKRVSGFSIYTNQSNANCNLKLYDVVSRKDCPSSGTYSDPAAAWYNGMGDTVTTGSTSSVTSNNLGCTPFQSPEFCAYYKIKKVTSVILSAGQSHHHYVKRNLNAIIHDESLNTGSNLKNLTHFTMAVAFGYPENDLVTPSIVTTAAAAVDCVSQLRYEYAWQAINYTKMTYAFGLGTLGAGGAELMQEVAGVVKGETNA